MHQKMPVYDLSFPCLRFVYEAFSDMAQLINRFAIEFF